VRYCKALARLWYFEGLATGAPSVANNLDLESNRCCYGVTLSHAGPLKKVDVMLYYCLWDKWRLSEDRVMEMLRKWCRTPRSVMANSELRRSMMRHRRSEEDAARTISMTYRSKCAISTLSLKMNREASDLAAVKLCLQT
jgi:hypothetical protein